ncbi:MAG TPA: outer membrane beta-barrel protein [Opitutaceae bacterium]|nr:outer membrane beta-barrel protein [Opitutaceae bacterium]
MNYAKKSLLAGIVLATIAVAHGQTPPSDTPTAVAASAPQDVQFYGWIELGSTLNATRPKDGQNFGRLFDDRADEILLNQLVYTAEKTLAPKAGEADWGFKLQGLLGSDARYTKSPGLLDDHSLVDHTVQPDIVEAYVNFHVPGPGAGGIDIKVGKFVTLEGYETIDPRSMPFYSHTYLFNFGIPFTHTGALATFHATKKYDLMFGVTRGVNTSLKDNNHSAAFHGGLAFNLGKFTGSFSTHFGPETPHNNHDYRWLHDLTFTYALSDKESLITDLNYVQDDAAKAKGYGVVEYYIQKITDALSWGIRGEIWKDADGFYVAQFANSSDYIRLLRGDQFIADARTVGGGATTYSAVTLGLHYNVPVAKPFSGLMIRPEVRYDRSSRTNAFVDSSQRDQWTFGIDAVLTF